MNNVWIRKQKNYLQFNENKYNKGRQLVKKNRDEIIKQFQIQLSCLFCRHFKKCDIVQICKLQEKYRKVNTDFSKLICKDFDLKRYLYTKKR